MEQQRLNLEPGPVEESGLDTPATSDAKPYRRVIDLGDDGAGQEVFESDEPLEFTPAQEKYIDKLVESKRHASQKIREQEAELRDRRARDDEEYVRKQSSKADQEKAEQERIAKESTEAISAFVAAHPDYEDEGKEGVRNGAVMANLLAKYGLPPTSENLHKAYLHLKESGFLALKSEGADTNAKGKEPERIETKPAAQVTRKTSGISTHTRPALTPASTEPSEDDAYKMPLHDLRRLANKQMGAR